MIGHVNHCLRGAESDADAIAVEHLAAALELPFAGRVAAVGDGSNLEERARDVRYDALREIAAANQCNRIAVGHTRDDQAETFLIRLVRGAGPVGLAGIHPLRSDGVIRPLLDCDRSAVAAVVADEGFVPREDASNSDQRFLRNRIRAELIPLLRSFNPDIVAACARASDHLRGAGMAEALWAENLLETDGGGLPTGQVSALDPALRGALLRAWVEKQAAAAVPGSRQIAAIEDLACSDGPGVCVELAGGWSVLRSGGELQVRRICGQPTVLEPTALPIGATIEVAGWQLRCEPARSPLALPKDLWTAVCDLAGGTGAGLGVRAPRSGERVTPMGMTGSKSIFRLLGEHGIPRLSRAAYPVVTLSDRPLWIPGVVRSTETAVCDSTADAVLLSARRLNRIEDREDPANFRGG